MRAIDSTTSGGITKPKMQALREDTVMMGAEMMSEIWEKGDLATSTKKR